MNAREVFDKFYRERGELESLGLKSKIGCTDIYAQALQALEQCLPTIKELLKEYERVRWEQASKRFKPGHRKDEGFRHGGTMNDSSERMEAIHALMVKKVRREET